MNTEKLQALAQRLVDNETMTGDDAARILELALNHRYVLVIAIALEHLRRQEAEQAERVLATALDGRGVIVGE